MDSSASISVTMLPYSVLDRCDASCSMLIMLLCEDITRSPSEVIHQYDYLPSCPGLQRAKQGRRHSMHNIAHVGAFHD